VRRRPPDSNPRNFLQSAEDSFAFWRRSVTLGGTHRHPKFRLGVGRFPTGVARIVRSVTRRRRLDGLGTRRNIRIDALGRAGGPDAGRAPRVPRENAKTYVFVTLFDSDTV
ncbi:MAG: hypothetical protein ACREFQ_22170, partial [Stellaceae bacterium]